VKDAARCGLGRVLVHGDNNNVAPRVGLTWQANSKTVVRGGFGIFSGRDENVGVARRLPTNPPFVTSATFVGDQNTPAFLLKDGFPANALSFASGSLDVINWPIYNKLPYVSQWNINLERPREFVFQVGYTGSGAKKMAGVVAINQQSPGTGSVNARRPHYGWGNMLSYNQYVASTYNGMIAKMERRFSKGMTLLASYTFGHSIDGGGNNNDSSDPGPRTRATRPRRKVIRISIYATVLS
jgi:hypothetical protein